jgi:hypothetical protein
MRAGVIVASSTVKRCRCRGDGMKEAQKKLAPLDYYRQQSSFESFNPPIMPYVCTRIEYFY